MNEKEIEIDGVKPIRIFPELYDIKPFINRDHPEYHPDSHKYAEYWEEQEKRCLEGFWGLDKKDDKGGWRWMPGNLYYYINFCVIKDEDEDGNATITINPLLRDVDWWLSYSWITARGFSGFEDDPEYTCHRIVKKYEKQKEAEEKGLKVNPKNELTPKEVEKLHKIDHIKKPDGSFKKYIDARDYLKQTFDKPKGKALFGNEALNLMVLGPRGWGKMTLPEEPIRVKDGWTTMENIQVGDKVYGLDGKLCNVISKTDLQTNLKMYKITLRDGRTATVCEDHKWYVWSKKHADKRYHDSPYINITTKELYKDYYYERVDSKHKAKYGKEKIVKEYKYALPTPEPLKNESKRNLELHPYVLGVLLGDGCLTQNANKITSIDKDLIERVSELLPKGYKINTLQSSEKEHSIVINGADTSFKQYLEKIGLNDLIGIKSDTKFIPDNYLYSSYEQRLELLKGLMDTDGTIGNNGGTIEYCTVSKRLSQDVQDLIRSLGMNCKVSEKNTGYKLAYRIYIYTDKNPFNLKRKKEIFNNRPINKTRKAKIDKTFIANIEPVENASGYCITVDNDTHTYLINNYIPTHNSYYAGNAVIGHEYTFFGKKYFDDKYLYDPSGVEIYVGSALASKSSDLLKKFSDSQTHIMKHVGSYGKHEDFVPGYFYVNSEGSLGPNNNRSPYRHEYEKKVAGTWVKEGTGTVIYHGVFTTENPQAAVGTRPTVIVIEEVGLCFGKGTKVRMYDGSIKNIEEIKEGDFLMGHDGSKRTVDRLFSGNEYLYKIEQKYGDDYIVSKDHILYLEQKCNIKSIKDDGIKKIKVQDFNEKNLGKYRLRTTYGIKNNSLKFDNNKKLTLSPYYVGAWIGDGTKNSADIAIDKKKSYELLEWFKDYTKSKGLKLKQIKNSIKYVPVGNKGQKNFFRQELKKLGIFNKKIIPNSYLLSSEQNRLELLAGLIDTDGNLNRKGKSNQAYEFNQTNRNDLVEQVMFLAKSLGFKVKLRKRISSKGYNNKELRNKRTKYIIRISGDIWKIPCKISYKKAEKVQHKKDFNRTPIKVKKIGKGEYFGFSLKEDPLFLLKDGTVVHNCPNLLTVLGANDTAQRRKNKFGSTIMIGTAGNMEKILESKIVFEDPESWHCLGFKDEWENRAKPIGFFVPAYYVDSDFKDENGNTDLEKALAQEMFMRKKLSESPNSAALDEYMMSRPIVPSEMFLSPTANIFPTAKLRQHLSELEAKQVFETIASIGDLHWTDPERKSVKWEEYINDGRLSLPITELNLDSYKHGLNSKIVIYEHPTEFIPSPTYRKSLYKVVYDPIRDEGGGTSLGAILVYKGFADAHNPGEQDSIVAEWIGRYDQPSEMHEICLKLAHYYNALILPENNIPGFINYCKMKGYVHKLMINPHEAVSKAIGNASTKYEWGLNMSNRQLKVHSEQLIREWLLEPWKTLDDGKVLYNLNKIKSPRLLKELINYDREQNMDAISAFMVLVIWLSQEREVVFKEEDVNKNAYDELNEYFNKEVAKKKTSTAWFS